MKLIFYVVLLQAQTQSTLLLKMNSLRVVCFLVPDQENYVKKEHVCKAFEERASSEDILQSYSVQASVRKTAHSFSRWLIMLPLIIPVFFYLFILLTLFFNHVLFIIKICNKDIHLCTLCPPQMNMLSLNFR